MVKTQYYDFTFIMNKFYSLEVVFAGIRNYNKCGSSCMSGRHRIKVMMGDLILSSGLSSARLKNSINFLIIYASGIVVNCI